VGTSLRFRTLDGLRLAATLTLPVEQPSAAVVLVHGGGVTREEGGFFTRLAAALGQGGLAALRYDLRGHGESDGRPAESSLAAHLNDIRVAMAQVREAADVSTVHLLGASFGGGLCAYYAAKHSDELERLVLLNPQLDYKNRYIDQKPHWSHDFLAEETAQQLTERGYIHHSPSVKHSRAFLNEVFWINPAAVLTEIKTPTLILHGTRDTFVPIESSRTADEVLTCEHSLVEIDGAQHGFAVHEDPRYLNPQTQAWQAFVIDAVVDWLTGASRENIAG
jgi:uncharacterized protein